MEAQPGDGPSPAQIARSVGMRDVVAALVRYRDDWPALVNDPVAHEALRGLAVRYTLYKAYEIDRRGECRHPVRRRWGRWRERRCQTTALLCDYGRANVETLWYHVRDALPVSWTTQNDVRRWLDTCETLAAWAAAPQRPDNAGTGDPHAHDEAPPTDRLPSCLPIENVP